MDSYGSASCQDPCGGVPELSGRFEAYKANHTSGSEPRDGTRIVFVLPTQTAQNAIPLPVGVEEKQKAVVCFSSSNHLFMTHSQPLAQTREMLNFSFSSISNLLWPKTLLKLLISATTFSVFTFLDLLDTLLCIFYEFFDAFVEKNSTPCYCHNRTKQGSSVEEQIYMSDTLYQRRNVFRDLGVLNWSRKRVGGVGLRPVKSRWSDCSCDSCLSWQLSGEHKLHVVVMEPSKASGQNCTGKQFENIIFLHGFMSSSSFWVESIFPNISESGNQNYRLFAVDLLGFGKSPKPWDSSYTLKDHVEMVEKSVIDSFNLKSFHIVGHSMGCIVALGLASKYSSSVKSITLVAPPCLPASNEDASLNALNILAKRRLWPPMSFGSSVMSWYEHLGRSICFIFCRNHQIWEWIMKLLLRKRDLHFKLVDATKHTHHSAWHSFHNVICGGAKLMDEYFEALRESRAVLTVIQGDQDTVVPLECSHNLKLKVPHAEVQIISNADHDSVIFGRERQFTRDLENIWLCSSRKTLLQEVAI